MFVPAETEEEERWVFRYIMLLRTHKDIAWKLALVIILHILRKQHIEYSI